MSPLLLSGARTDFRELNKMDSKITSIPPIKLSDLRFKEIPPGEVSIVYRAIGIDEQMFTTRITKNYLLAEFPITSSIWRSVMGDSGHYEKPRNPLDEPYCPVLGIGRTAVDEFILRASNIMGLRFALPTIAQWLHACKSGNSCYIHTLMYISVMK